MKLLTNPVLVRMVLVLVAAVFSFIMGWVIVRRMRRSLMDDGQITPLGPATESLLPHTYATVIQQLKQQKHELQSQQQAERRRARTSENISAVVLSNLSCGVMFFSPNGLVRQSNPVAKQILGFASPVGMNARDIFRDAVACDRNAPESPIAEMVENCLREGKSLRRLAATYRTPAGEERTLELTLTRVLSVEGDALGHACLINDQSEIARIQQQQELRGEISAEMALELRNSLATIAGYAQQLAASRDPSLARQLANDIAEESALLDRRIGGFLSEARAARAAAKS